MNIPNWATLRVLGQSPAMRLTILVPLLGSLLLFNNEVVGWAKLSEAAVRSWLHVPAEQKEEVALQYTISRLQMLYLGLTVLGVAAALFNGLCPPEIKSHGSNREYQEAELPTMTRARTAMLLVKMGKPPTDGYLAANWLLVCNELTKQNADPTLIANAIREANFPALERIARDLLSLHYDTLLESKKAGRAVIAGAYCIGFVLLLWPTGATFARIVWSIRPWA